MFIMFLKEINAILGEKLSAEDEEEILAEFENLESQVRIFFCVYIWFISCLNFVLYLDELCSINVIYFCSCVFVLPIINCCIQVFISVQWLYFIPRQFTFSLFLTQQPGVVFWIIRAVHCDVVLFIFMKYDFLKCQKWHLVF